MIPNNTVIPVSDRFRITITKCLKANPHRANYPHGILRNVANEFRISRTISVYRIDFPLLKLPCSTNRIATRWSNNTEEHITHDYVQATAKPVKPLTSSRTLDSLAELQSTKINTPSMSSSGYGSQAVSTTNLTSEDSLSVKSISVDETPDLEYRNLLDAKKPDRMDSSLVEETPEEYLGEVTSTLDKLNVMGNSCMEGELDHCATVVSNV